MPSSAMVESPKCAMRVRCRPPAASARSRAVRASAAWNARSAYLLFNGLDGNPRLDRHLDDHGQLDLTASWRLRRGFTLFVEGINLTNRAERAYDGDPARRLDYLEYRGWSGNAGVPSPGSR